MKKIVFVFIFALFFFSADTASAQTCASPVTPGSVTVDYPYFEGSSGNLTRAGCSWDLQGDAASYNVTVTEVETGTIIMNNENQAGTTSSVSFPITQLRTYKCDVVAVASCGAISSAASDQLLCDADALIDTPTPTQAQSSNPVIPTKAPAPSIAPPGGVLETVGILGGVALVLIAGVIFFVL